MKRLLRYLLGTVFLFAFSLLHAQTIFWTEDFGTGCNDGQLASGFTTTNGTWTMTSGTNGLKANTWYISASENGNAVGACGTGCGTNRTLHVGPIAYPLFGITADGGARYYAGGVDPSNTDRRIETPVINCSGRTSITMRFKYMENGEGANDDATVWYYDGSTWAQLSNPAKTALTCNPQGIWTAYSFALPASADNNPNVKIGFRWVNDDNMMGTDPSFAVDDVTLEVPAGAIPVANFSSTDTTICVGTCIGFNDLSTNSPTSWSWTFTGASPNSSTVQNPTNICYNTAGTYTVTLVATNGSGSDTETKTNFINVVAIPSVSIAPAAPAICEGGSVTLNASGATTYQWSPSAGLSSVTVASPVATPTVTTTYTVTGTTSGCTGTASVVVTVNPNPVVSVTPAAPTICNGDPVTLTATGATTYNWDPATGLSGTTGDVVVATPSSTITYTVTGTTGSCSGTTTVVVTVGAAVVAFAGNDTTVCEGSSVSLNATGGTGYQWSPPDGLSSTTIANPVASPTATTTYTVTVSSGTCTPATDEIVITVEPLPIANAGNDVTICNGDTTQLNASGGITYLWSPATGLSDPNIANPLASPTATTTYTVSVTVGNCSDVDTVIVTVGGGTIASAGPDVTICEGQSTTLNASGGNIYQWSPTASLSDPNIFNPVASPTVTTTYTVTVTSGSCTPGTDAVVVTVVPPPAAMISGNTTVCLGMSTTLTASGGTTYLWSTGETTASIVATPTAGTTYSVTVSNGSCSGTASLTVTPVIPVPVVASPSDTTIVQGESVQLTATGGVSWIWIPPGSLSCSNCQNTYATPEETTMYIVTATDSGGCTSRDTVIVNVELNCGEIFIPSAFSPNNDQSNDVLYVRGRCIQSLDFAVYDRWGEKVFSTTSQDVGWDGKLRGQNMDNGVFVYYLSAYLKDGTVINKQGSVNLIR